MHVIVPRNDLIRLLEATIGSAEPKSAMPALANVLLATTGTEGTPSLRASCTTLYQATTGTTAGEVVESGSIAVDVKALLARTKTMPVGPVELLASESHVITIKALGRPRRFQMTGIPGAEFPQLQEPGADASWVEIEAAILARLLNHTAYAMSSDTTRPNVNSTLVQWEGSTLRFVTTDGHRLAMAEIKAPSSQRMEMLIPADAIEQMRKVLAVDPKTKVKLASVDPNVFLDIGTIRFSAKCAAAQFPPYAQLLAPAQTAASPSTLRADRDRLCEILAAVRVSSAGGILRLDVIAGMVRASNVEKDQATKGASVDEMEVTYDGPSVAIGFQAAYLEQALKAMPEGDVVAKLGTELDPILVEPATPEAGETVLALVMPARLDVETKVAA
jgi:DNA polymerase-3 subunit beta